MNTQVRIKLTKIPRILDAIVISIFLVGCAPYPPTTMQTSPQTEKKTWDYYDDDGKIYATVEFTRNRCEMTARFNNLSDRNLYLENGNLVASNPKQSLMLGSANIYWKNKNIRPGYATTTRIISWWPPPNLGPRCDSAEYEVDQVFFIVEGCHSKIFQFCAGDKKDTYMIQKGHIYDYECN